MHFFKFIWFRILALLLFGFMVYSPECSGQGLGASVEHSGYGDQGSGLLVEDFFQSVRLGV
jgi:hypothetical protein